MPDFTERDLDQFGKKPRPKGTLTYLPSSREPGELAAWLTDALRPPLGWRVTGFERLGRDMRDPALLQFANGREHRTYRFKRQSDLTVNSRRTLVAASDGWLAVPHLTATEVEDIWLALCQLGQVMTEWDEAEQTREWMEQLLRATTSLTGHTLVPDGRHEGLMALKRAGQFTKSDALILIRPTDTESYYQRPVRFVDAQTGEQWVRAGEAATFIRWVVGVEPLAHGTLRARLKEIGVTNKLFEDYRPPHPKLHLYSLSETLVEGLE